jgi:mono/diheme cytochrome c family protein
VKRAIIVGLVAVGAALVWSYGAAQEKRQDHAGQNPEEIRLIHSVQGPALYQAYCASCHGKDAKGDGPIAKSLKIPPSDLTRIAMRNGGTFPMARVEGIISGEAPLPGVHGSREMPVWGPIFSQVAWDMDLGRVRINNLARYLREIQATK